jgi:4-hydroxy-tetrahydrodipicolinate synthase
LTRDRRNRLHERAGSPDERGDDDMPKQFRGSYTVTITPFTEDGKKIDLPAWRRFVDWQIKLGVPGIIILGTTGEFLTISDDERRMFVEATVRHVAGRMHVLAGTMNAYTPHAVRYSREAEELGADGLMIIPPYYYTPTDDEIFAYYKAICDKVSIPIMLYNNPFTSNVDMSAKLVARLTKAFEQIRYIKEASQDTARVYDVIEETKGVMNVFAGERIVESYLLGAVGYVNPYGNYIPRASYRICDFITEGRIEDAKKIERLINKMQTVINEGHPTYGHQCYSKALAAAAGYPVGDVRPPLTTFKALGKEGEARLKKLKPIMKELDDLMDKLEARGPGRGLRVAAE